MGDVNQIKYKLQSYSHKENADISEEQIENAIENKKDLFGRDIKFEINRALDIFPDDLKMHFNRKNILREFYPLSISRGITIYGPAWGSK